MQIRFSASSLALPLLIFALAAVALFTLLRSPSAATFDIGAPGDAYSAENFYAAEADAGTRFRWSGPGARLRLYDAYPGALILSLHAYRAEITADRPWPLHLRDARGDALATLELQPGWRIYRTLLDHAGDATYLDTPTFRPGADDPRPLGFALARVRIDPVANAPFAAPLAHAIWLAWLAALLFWLGDVRFWFAGRAARDLADHLPGLALASVGAVGLVIWAWRAPYTLAWALPTNVWATGLAAAALVAIRVGVPAWRALSRAGRGVPPAAVGIGGVALVGLAHLALLLPLAATWRGAAAWVVLATPGVLLAGLLFRAARDPLVRVFLGLCGGLALPALLTLTLQALPGPLPGWALLAASDALSLVAGWLLLRQSKPRPAAIGYRLSAIDYPHAFLPLLLIMLLGAALRLPMLGNAEFQGDEAVALLLASGLPHGQDDILLLHMKGPVEALLPAAPLIVAGQINEWVARLPFAVAGIGALLGAYVLACALFGAERGTAIGLLAAAILALDGFLIGFARIVQYQSIVVLLSMGAFWACWRFYQTPEREAGPADRNLIAAAVMAAVAILAHYDGGFVAPALAGLVIAGGRRRCWRGWDWVRGLALPTLVGAALLASFYVPFMLHASFGHTADYLQGRTGQSTLFNNLPGYYTLLTFYNAAPKIQALAAALAAALAVAIWVYVRPRRLGRTLALWFLIGCALLAVEPALLDLSNGMSWAIVVLGAPIATLALAPSAPPELRALTAWFGAPFVAEAFFIGDPRTHFYTLHVAAALLIAFATLRATAWLSQRGWCWLNVGIAAGGVALLLISAPYAGLIFVRQMPEYYRRYPDALVPFYRPASGEELPADGFFGFPHRDGWPVVGELYARGVLRGDYASNQKIFISAWYTRGAFNCLGDPEYYFTARYQTPLYIPPGYHLFGSVVTDGAITLDIYSRAPVEGAPQMFDSRDFRTAFDDRPVANVAKRRLLKDSAPQYKLERRWTQGVTLHGFDLDRRTLGSGDAATATFYWRATQPLDGQYEVELELADSMGRVSARGAPLCSSYPPEQWHTVPSADVAFTLAADGLAPGDYTLRVSIRRRDGAGRLPLADGGDITPITTVRVIEADEPDR